MTTKRPISPKGKSRKNRRSFFGTRYATDTPSTENSTQDTTSPAKSPFTTSPTGKTASVPHSQGLNAFERPPTTPRPRHVDIFDAVQTLHSSAKSSNKNPTAPSPAPEETPKRKAARFFTAGLHIFDQHARDILAQRNLDAPRYNAPSIADTAAAIWAEMVENDHAERKFWDDAVLEARFALAEGSVGAEKFMRANGLPEREGENVLRAEGIVDAYFGRLKEKEEENDDAEEGLESAVQQTLTPVKARIVDVGSK